MPLTAMHAHITILRWYCLVCVCVMLQIMNSSFPSLNSAFSGASWFLSHLSIGSCPRTVLKCTCLLANSSLHVFVVNDYKMFTLYLLWHRHAYPLEVVLDLDYCCKGVFLLQGKNFIYHNCFPWSSGPFGVPQHIIAIVPFKILPNFWFGHKQLFAITLMCLFWFFYQMMACSLTVTAL